MKKIVMAESQLRGLVKKLIKEEMNISYRAIMNGVKNGSAPFTIVALQRDFNARNGYKVLGQSITRIPDAVPAHYEGMIKDYPQLTNIVIEDSTGKIVFKDEINKRIKEESQLMEMGRDDVVLQSILKKYDNSSEVTQKTIANMILGSFDKLNFNPKMTRVKIYKELRNMDYQEISGIRKRLGM